MPRQLSIAAFMMRYGHHVAAWRHPETDLAVESFQGVSRAGAQCGTGLSGCGVFADSVALTGAPSLEPLTLLSALAASTERIGLIGTATTTYNEPYTVARQFASLDLLSDGRAGWNLVTSDNAAEAANFGRDQHVAHADRYARAREFHQVVTGLWNSWDPDALEVDKTGRAAVRSGQAAQAESSRRAFRCCWSAQCGAQSAGPAGGGAGWRLGDGRDLAAATAEVVFTAQPTLAKAQAFYSDIKRRVVERAASRIGEGDAGIVRGGRPHAGGGGRSSPSCKR
jgi:alkanesulfonate monooxygenase SsuD/methylene tetrahydromethanopterin reductase-like flavin-dependent oxidoreductase (luciferase family)